MEFAFWKLASDLVQPHSSSEKLAIDATTGRSGPVNMELAYTLANKAVRDGSRATEERFVERVRGLRYNLSQRLPPATVVALWRAYHPVFDKMPRPAP